MIENLNFDRSQYPALHDFTHMLKLNPNPLLGGDDTLETISAALHKTEMSNALLLAEAGGGKTATVQEFARRYSDEYIVLETSIAQLESGGVEYLAKNFKELFAELGAYRKQNQMSKRLVLFLDEIHQLPMASPAAVEDLKPEFARSSQLGIHIIGATTYEEYIKWIKPNMALTERFQVINLPVANDKLTYKILKSRMKKQHDVRENFETDRILKEIIYYTDTYIKDRIQPRKSTDILDQMMGWVRIGHKFDHNLLAKVFYINTQIRVDLQLDVKGLKSYLNNRVFNQPMAVNALLGNAYSATLGVTDPNKPRGAFLFVGSTGTGKTELAKAFTDAMFGSNAHLIIFDMAEYQNDEDVKKFQYNLTDTMLEANTPVILLDEIEKANAGVGRLLFSVLDEARLADRNGRPVNFSNVFFLFTTNAGDTTFDYLAGRNYSDREMQLQLSDFNKLIFSNLKDDPQFPAPLLGRMTGFVPFAPMTTETNKKIAIRQLKKTAKIFMDKQNVKVRYDMTNLLRFITHEKIDNSSDAGGARQIVNLVRKNVTNAISQYLIFNPGTYDVYVTTAGKARTQDKFRLTSAEYVTVNATPKEIIQNDYDAAVTKFKPTLVKRLQDYRKRGILIKANSKDIFGTLARIDLNDDLNEAVDAFFEPLEHYIETIDDWNLQFGKNPALATSPKPSNRVVLTINNNELIVNEVKAAKTR